MQWCKILEKY